MLTIPTNLITPEGWIRVLGIDPSTSNMGITMIDVNMFKEEKFKLVYVNTIYGDKVNYAIPDQFNDEDHTGVEARCYGLARAFKQLAELYSPDVVTCEDNFLGASADTFKQLIKCVNLLREYANKLDLHMSFVLPNLAKDIVGANFRGTQKEDVIRGIQTYPWLNSEGFDLTVLDEHSADSVAIALYRCEQIAKHYKVFHYGAS
ncbi:RuvC-like Holliday junction resolvase [Shewanella phage FishSpeaker]|nr:RuvC-like Holliday junction resolvase [Shewanella phage FishSpeaker]